MSARPCPFGLRHYACDCEPPPSVLQSSPSAWSNDLHNQIVEALHRCFIGAGDTGRIHLIDPESGECTPCEGRAAAVMSVVEPVVERARAGCCADGDATFAQMRDALQGEVTRLRRQVQGYKGMKDVYLRERNTAHTELLQAEQIIKGLCDAIDRVQALPPSPLPSGEGRLPERGYQEGWETALTAVHSALHPPKETL